jgi:hypothetical protein
LNASITDAGFPKVQFISSGIIAKFTSADNAAYIFDLDFFICPSRPISILICYPSISGGVSKPGISFVG